MNKKLFVLQRYNKIFNEWIYLNQFLTKKTAIKWLNTCKEHNSDIDYRVAVYEKDDYFYGYKTILEVIK